MWPEFQMGKQHLGYRVRRDGWPGCVEALALLVWGALTKPSFNIETQGVDGGSETQTSLALQLNLRLAWESRRKGGHLGWQDSSAGKGTCC